MKKLNVFKHFILTRYNTQQQPDGGFLYDDVSKANKWMEARMKLFEKTRKSVLDQEGEFEWIISLDSRTPNRFIQEIITDSRMKVVNCDIRDTFDRIELEEPWVITSRLDNDDLYLPGAVLAIQSCFTNAEIIVDLRYYQKKGSKLFSSGTERDGWVRPNPNSPFLSLIEKTNKEKIRTAFARPHNLMTNEYKGVWPTNDVLAYQVIHGANAANKIVGKEVK
jgi:hypothetical protein